MSISNKRSTVRSVELSQTVAPEEMLAVEELSVMQAADVLDKEAREQASKQSAEDEALQVAQVDMPTEYLENPAAAAEVMSDVGEAGLIGEESISRWEAQEVAFAGAGGGAGAGFWGGMGGFGAAAGGIAAGGLAHQNSMDSSAPGGGNSFTGDTTVVVFDLINGVSSDHSGRTFDAGTTYDVYIYIDSNTFTLNTTPGGGAAADATWGVWNAVANLGADDTIHLVADSPVDIVPTTVGTGYSHVVGTATTLSMNAGGGQMVWEGSAWTSFTISSNPTSTSVFVGTVYESMYLFWNGAGTATQQLLRGDYLWGTVFVFPGTVTYSISTTGTLISADLFSNAATGISSGVNQSYGTLPGGLLTTQGLA